MKKILFESFIRRYSLNGLVESVKFVVDSKEKQLKTSFVSIEKNVLGSVVLNKFDDIAEDAEIGIYDTPKLKQMLSVLGEDIKLSLTKNDKGMVTSLCIADDDSTIQFVTADLEVIKKVPGIKNIPEFNVEIDLNGEFVTKFIKAQNSLSKEKLFTLLMNKKDILTMTIGYSNINSNRITLTTKTLNGKDKLAKEISFNAEYFKEMLAANTDCVGSIFRVSDVGLSLATFSTADFNCNYYIVESKRD